MVSYARHSAASGTWIVIMPRRPSRIAAARAKPSASGSSALTECQRFVATRGTRPPPQNHTLFTAGSPRASRASFTACECSTICDSLSSWCELERRLRVERQVLLQSCDPALGIDHLQTQPRCEMAIERFAQQVGLVARDV